MNEAYNLLKDVVQFPEKEIAEYFNITETEKEWTIKAYRYLDGPTFGKILRAIMDRQGGYQKDETTKFAIFTLPKTPSTQATDSPSTYKEPSNEIQKLPLNSLLPPRFRVRVKPEMELGDLVESIKKYGVLQPISVRPKDNLYEIVAGERRVKAAKTAGLTEIPAIIKELSDVDAFSIQLAENLQRIDLTPEEKSMALAEYAKFTKYNGKQIAVALSKSYSWVMTYLPQDFKDKDMVELGKLGAESKADSKKEQDLHVATSLVPTSESKPISEKEQDLGTSETARQKTFVSTPAFARTQQEMAQQIIDCEACGKPMDRSRAAIVGGKIVCPKCVGKDKLLTPRKLEEETAFKPKEKPEFRRAVMQPQKSKFELEVIQQLQAEGLPLETDQEFCIQKTVPDATLKLKDRTIAIYIDNAATHQEGDETDEFLRSRLEKLHPEIHVCVVQYKNDSAEERQRAKQTIREYLKW